MSDLQVYRFSIIARTSTPPPVSGDALIALAEALGNRDATDLTVSGHCDGVVLEADREAGSLGAAIASAIEDAEAVGLQVKRIDVECGEPVESAA